MNLPPFCRKSFIPSTMTLLIALGASAALGDDIGINLNENEWFRTQALWSDLTNSLGPWYSNQNFSLTPTPLVPASSIDSTTGFPTINQAWIASPFSDYPQGTYNFTYTGGGTGGIFFGGDATNVSSSTVGNVTSGTVTFDASKNDSRGFVIRYDRDASSPITSLQLYSNSLGTPANVFNNHTLQNLQPFSTVRYMDLLHTNSNTATMNWADRTQPTEFTQTDAKGIAYEDIVASANAMHHDIWINVPVNATSDYMRNLGTFLSNNLDPALKVNVEYGNEMWNFGTAAGAALLHNAQMDANTAGADNSDTARAGREMAIKLLQIHNQMSLGYADATTAGTAKSSFNNVGLVFGGFTRPDQSGYDFTTEGLKYFSDKLGVAASSVIKSLAIAGYVDTGLSDPNTAGSVDNIFTLMNDELNAPSAQQPNGGTVYAAFKQNKTLADTLGLQLSVYEGGQSLLHDNDNTLANDAQKDPKMALLYHRLFQTWDAVGGTGPFLAYSYADDNNDFGAWGLLERSEDKGSMKWDAVLREILHAGDANLDGKVNYADFLILSQNYGLPAMWWEQGNFDSDQDGTVDAADFLAMYKNLDGLNPTEMQSVLNFAAKNNILLPEPTTAAALAAGLAKFGLRRPRRTR